MPTFTLHRLSWLPSFSLPTLCGALLLGTLSNLSGCHLLEQRAASSVVADNATVRVRGVAQPSHIGKNPAGMPIIEANNFHDLLFTFGYSHASDRLTQMVQLRLLAQGRLAELHGAEMLNLDRLMRSINLSNDAQTLYKNAPKNLQTYFEIYARGINAYIYQMRDTLPPDLARANYQPEYWKAEDSALLFALFSFSQSGNLSEEVLALATAQHLDKQKLPWLFPIYPDEPLALNDADKLLTSASSAISNPALRANTLHLLQTLNQLASVNSMRAPLATSWVSSAQQTVSRGNLLALNTLQSKSPTAADTTAPALYSWANLHSPQLKAAGLSIPGVPLLISGFNGKLAYSISALMADTQDVFIEKLRQHKGRLEYLSNGQWQPAQQRMETFVIRGQQPVREALYRTAHGPLLSALPQQHNNGFGLALQRSSHSDDRSLEMMWQLLRSASVERATQVLPDLRALPANVLLADAQHTAWQVTGSYPNRRNSRGLFPSAGWDNSVAWEGYADPMLYPYDQDQQRGWLSAANQRLTQPGYGMQLSSSWANPERAENLALQLAKKSVSANIALQNNAQQRPWLITQLQQMLNSAGMPEALSQALKKLPTEQRIATQQVLRDFLAIDAQQPLSKAEQNWLAHWLKQTEEQLLKQQLQGLPNSLQQGFALHNQHSYPAWLDHLLGRDDSPFWQGAAPSKAQFLLDSLLTSQQALGQPAAEQLNTSQTLLVDFSRAIPVSAASFSGQADNSYSPYYQLPKGVAGRLYPLPVTYKEINAVYAKQRLTLLPTP